MIGQYIAYSTGGISSGRLVTILMVWCDGMCRQEERSRIRTTQRQGKRHRQMSLFAGGLLVGAVTAGGIVAGLLELKAKRDATEAGNILSWPALSGTERRHSR